jgi:hypothetical protein
VARRAPRRDFVAAPRGPRQRHGAPGQPARLPAPLVLREYLAQIRETISLTGRLTPADLTPGMRDDLVSVCRRWLAEG